MAVNGGRRSEEWDADRRRHEVLKAANHIVMRDGPDVSMSAIAEEAGVPKPSLYRQFGNKNGLYRALARQHAEAVLHSCLSAFDSGPDRRDRIEAALDAYLATMEESPNTYRFLMHPVQERTREPDDADWQSGPGGKIPPTLHRLGEMAASITRDRLELGPQGDLIAKVWGHALVGMVHGVGEWWQKEHLCSRAELVRLLADLLCSPLDGAADELTARDDPAREDS